MCSFKLLEQNETGFIKLCTGCDRLQIVFGNVAFALNEESFIHFGNMLKADSHKHAMVTDKYIRNIYLESPCKNLFLVFSADEYQKMTALFEQAMHSLQIVKLLNA